MKKVPAGGDLQCQSGLFDSRLTVLALPTPHFHLRVA